MTNKTLYEELGGHDAIYAVVTKMYKKILGDKNTSFFFANTDIEKLRHMTSEFVSIAFGAPCNYTGKNLRDAHKNLLPEGLNDSHFDAVIRYLKEAIDEIGADEHLVSKGLAIVETTRKDVLNK